MLPLLMAAMNNPMFVALGGTAIITGLMVTLRNIPKKIWDYFVYLFTVSVHLENTDESFYWMTKYLAEHPSTLKMRKLRLGTQEDPRSFSRRSEEGTKWIFSPGLGTSWFWMGWRLVIIHREITAGRNDNDKPREHMSIRVLGRSQAAIRQLFDKARTLADKETKQKIYQLSDYGDWEVAIRKKPRAISTIILKDDQQERIVADLEQFFANEEFYLERGIPYHRGYLFKGPPGTGKTSIISSLAAKFSKHVAILSLSTIASDKALFNALSNIPSNCVVAIEDVDCASDAVTSRDKKDDKKSKGKSAVTLAGLLNALDGIMTPEGSVFIMTTNYPELLDTALIRPGRVDMQETFGLMGKNEQERMSALFYETPISVDHEVSPAQMQGILMQFADDPKAAKNALEALKPV